MFFEIENKNFFLKSKCEAGFCRFKLHEIFLPQDVIYVNLKMELPTERFFKLHQTATCRKSGISYCIQRYPV